MYRFHCNGIKSDHGELAKQISIDIRTGKRVRMRSVEVLRIPDVCYIVIET